TPLFFFLKKILVGGRFPPQKIFFSTPPPPPEIHLALFKVSSLKETRNPSSGQPCFPSGKQGCFVCCVIPLHP
ncbi:MAG: hypothetical protein FWD77_08120, partial [Betaproteobacteria bacterium]|nr:hypothetical protein [Betaproteobacteria bacterium]